MIMLLHQPRQSAVAFVKCRHLLPIIFLSALLGGNASAQVKFVQLTDPHLFDKAGDEGLRNREILVDAVAKINELNETNKYAFVVVTGDIGIEQIVKTASDAELQRKLSEGASTMANILAPSTVKVWLFVPGNNDLLDEMDNTIDSYHQLIAKLHDALSSYHIDVVDLCLQSSPIAYTPEKSKEYVFIGFNNASFKNNNDASRLSETVEECCDQPSKCSPAGKIRCVQRAEIQRVSELLEKAKRRFAYVFYHIPEVDDPFLKKEEKEVEPSNVRKLYEFHQSRKMRAAVTGSDFVNSSWFVDTELRKKWVEIAARQNVKGLFAGHLHVNMPDYYGRDANNPKLYICPPLAIKLQPLDEGQARGFQEVSIDKGASSAALTGQVSTNIYWYDQAHYLFAAGSPPPTFTRSPQPPNGRSMSWETLAHIAAIAQFFVVVVSVGFIWYQLRQQTKLARFANTQALVTLSSPFNLEMAQDKEMAELWTIGRKEWDALDEGRRQQHESMLKWWFIFYENIFFQAERKLLDTAIFAAWKKDMDVFVEEQYVEKYWSRLSQKYHKEFAEYLNARIKIKEESQKITDDGPTSASN